MAEALLNDASRERNLARVPCLDEMFARIAGLVLLEAGAEFRILELGAGSGALCERMLAHFERAETTLVESSEPLRRAAEMRLARFAGHTEFVAGDFAGVELPRGYHLILSAFQFHAAADIERRALYRSVYPALVPDGMLVIADEVRGASGWLESLYRTVWHRDVREAGASPGEIETMTAELDRENGMVLAKELPWLSHVGFRDVDIYYKNLRFAVYGGRRPDTRDFTFPSLRDEKEPGGGDG